MAAKQLQIDPNKEKDLDDFMREIEHLGPSTIFFGFRVYPQSIS